MKKMSVRPAGKGAFFLDITKHLARIVFDMAGVKVKREGPRVHLQFDPTPGIYTPLAGDDTASLPGWEETFQCPRSAVI